MFLIEMASDSSKLHLLMLQTSTILNSFRSINCFATLLCVIIWNVCILSFLFLRRLLLSHHCKHLLCVCLCSIHVCVCRTLQQAASVPVVYATAFYSLVVRGKLRPGETVLIHSGSGGVGQAAIAIALSMQCRVFTTVGSCGAPSCRAS